MPALTGRALPRRFRRQRLLIVGCGDVGQRLAALVRHKWRVYGLVRSPETAARVRAAGALPILAGPADRRRLQALATLVLHSAPPPAGATDPGRGTAIDPLTRDWCRRLAQPGRPAGARSGAAAIGPGRLAYLGTTGVYGDRQGRPTSEATPIAPQTDRAWRRADAEQRLRALGRPLRRATGGPARRRRWRAVLLRVPGIYALDRLPLERLAKGVPVLPPAQDVHTNHIEAGDLARAAVVALARGRAGRAYNVVDDSASLMADYMDAVAAWAGLPAPPRLAREILVQRITPMAASFMAESRRLTNRRLKDELRLRLRYPTVATFLAAHSPPPQRPRDADAP